MSSKKDKSCNRRYTTAAAFKRAVELYFTSLQEPILVYNKRERRNEYLFDANEEIVYHEKKPPTMSGLCHYLGFNSRTTIGEYEKLGQEWADIISRARLRIETSWTERLAVKDSSKGAEFALRCHFGWIPEDTRRELELREKQSKIPEEQSGVNLIINVEDCTAERKIEETENNL